MHYELEFRFKWKFFFSRLDMNSISEPLYTNYFDFLMFFCILINVGMYSISYKCSKTYSYLKSI